MSLRSFYAAVLVLVSTCAAVGALVETTVAAGPNPKDVTIDNFSFTDQAVTIPAGTQVHWTNRDDIPHTVVSEDKIFKSKVLDTDEQFTYAFTRPGTYRYFCSLHPKMTGTVVVQ